MSPTFVNEFPLMKVPAGDLISMLITLFNKLIHKVMYLCDRMFYDASPAN